VAKELLEKAVKTPIFESTVSYVKVDILLDLMTIHDKLNPSIPAYALFQSFIEFIDHLETGEKRKELELFILSRVSEVINFRGSESSEDLLRKKSFLEKAVLLRKKYPGSNEHEEVIVGKIYIHLGVMANKTRDFEEASHFFQQALQIFENTSVLSIDERSSYLMMTLPHLFNSYVERNKFVEAAETTFHLIKVQQSLHGEIYINVRDLNNLFSCSGKTQDPKFQKELLEKAPMYLTLFPVLFQSSFPSYPNYSLVFNFSLLSLVSSSTFVTPHSTPDVDSCIVILYQR